MSDYPTERLKVEVHLKYDGDKPHKDNQMYMTTLTGEWKKDTILLKELFVHVTDMSLFGTHTAFALVAKDRQETE